MFWLLIQALGDLLPRSINSPLVHTYEFFFDIFGWTFVGLISMCNINICNWYFHLLLYAAKSTSLWFYCRLLAFTRASCKIYSPNTSVCKVNCNNMRGIKYSSTTQSGFCLILSPPRKKIATWDTQRLNSTPTEVQLLALTELLIIYTPVMEISQWERIEGTLTWRILSKVFSNPGVGNTLQCLHEKVFLKWEHQCNKWLHMITVFDNITA